MYSPPYLFPVEAINLETFHNNDRLQSSNTVVTEFFSIYKFELRATGERRVKVERLSHAFFLWSGKCDFARFSSSLIILNKSR